MIKITEKAKKELCEKLSIDDKKLTFLGGGREDSDGTVYIYQEQGTKKVLKILAIPQDKPEKLKELEARIQFASYLGEHGVKLVYPLRNRNKNLYETSLDQNQYYTAYVMDYCEGRNPESTELTDDIIFEWGKVTGKSHAITKSFTNNDYNVNIGYEQEIEFFYDWCKDLQVKDAWLHMKRELSNLPKGINEYGFIHNDNHQRNILVSGKNLTLIDFDCAGYQFFIQDIITPAQGIMFDITGGMTCPVKETERLKHFFDCFLNGYETQNHLDSLWLEKIPLFLNYRRMLLFTCMQDWLNTVPELKNGMKKNIEINM